MNAQQVDGMTNETAEIDRLRAERDIARAVIRKLLRALREAQKGERN